MDGVTRDAVEYIRKLFDGNADGHGTEHTLRVWRNAMMIAETEPDCDRNIVSLAALLHDADDYKLFTTENNANARRFLTEHLVPEETAEKICAAINAVSFSKNRDRRPETLEGQIVQDADRLDAIGAVGIARTFAYGGRHGRTPEDSIMHFHEKLLLLKDMMNTRQAKAAAEEKHAFMETLPAGMGRRNRHRAADRAGKRGQGMRFRHFSGAFGLYDRTALLETGSAGFADVNFAIQNDPSFSYQTASGTKGFTAAAVLTLAAEGKAGLDDAVRDILRSSADPRRYGELEWLDGNVTIRSLLDHTSGIPDYFDEEITDDFEGALNGTRNDRYERPEDFFPLMEEAWKRQDTPYASRNSFKYSNGGFVVLAAVVEAASGEPFPEYVSGHVFQRCGMDGSGFFRLDGQAPGGVVRATAYRKDGRSNIYSVPVIGGGDGGAYTNPADMARFWNRLDPETGARLFRQLVDEVRGTFRGVNTNALEDTLESAR